MRQEVSSTNSSNQKDDVVQSIKRKNLFSYNFYAQKKLRYEPYNRIF